jgi:hypothetical protein
MDDMCVTRTCPKIATGRPYTAVTAVGALKWSREVDRKEMAAYAWKLVQIGVS